MQSEVQPPVTVGGDGLAPFGSRVDGSQAPRPPRRRRRRVQLLPYWLVLPGVLVVFGFMAYPLYRMVILATHRTPLAGRFAPHPPAPVFVGFDNFKAVLKDHQFIDAVIRTFVFTVSAVGLSMVISLAVALLMRRVSKPARIVVTIALVSVWAVPTIVATQIFSWLFDSDFGAINYMLNLLPGVHMQNHSWFSSSTQGWAVITGLVLWGAIPFLALTLYAGLTQVPAELVEAATIDGASPWQVLRNVLIPVLRPVLVITTTLSVIWDFSVFNQIYALRAAQPETAYYTIGVYAYEVAFGRSDYNTGATISLITMVLMLGVMIFYIRQMIRIGEAD